MPAIWAGWGTPTKLSPFAEREKPTAPSTRACKENAEWMPFESSSRSFKVWKKDCVSSAFEPRTCDGHWMVTSCVGLGLGFAVFLTLFTRYHVERLGTKLLQSEERWTATLGSIGDAVIATDSEARVTFLNPVAAALTGWPPEEAQNQPLQDVFKIINEQTGMGADDEVLRVLEERQILAVTNHVALIARDGREIPVEHSAAPILAGGGKVIGVVLVFRDVAERRQEQEATAEQAALLELTQDSVFVIDMDGTIRFWSRGAEAMLGYSKEPGRRQNLARPASHRVSAAAG